MFCVCFRNNSIQWSAESMWRPSSQDQKLKQPLWRTDRMTHTAERGKSRNWESNTCSGPGQYEHMTKNIRPDTHSIDPFVFHLLTGLWFVQSCGEEGRDDCLQYLCNSQTFSVIGFILKIEVLASVLSLFSI